jgi:peroxiredoxin
MDKEKLTWRSFADSRHSICETWNLASTPTLYVLDANGVIRYKWSGSPGHKVLDAALERLIEEAK